MAEFVLDLSDVGGGPDPVPAGDYRVRVASVTAKPGAKGPYLSYQLEIIEGPYKERHLLFMTSLSNESRWSVRAALEALGKFEEHITLKVEDESGTLLYPRLVNCTAIAQVIVQPYKGKNTNYVEILRPLEEGSAPPAAAGQEQQAAFPAFR